MRAIAIAIFLGAYVVAIAINAKAFTSWLDAILVIGLFAGFCFCIVKGI